MLMAISKVVQILSAYSHFPTCSDSYPSFDNTLVLQDPVLSHSLRVPKGRHMYIIAHTTCIWRCSCPKDELSKETKCEKAISRSPNSICEDTEHVYTNKSRDIVPCDNCKANGEWQLNRRGTWIKPGEELAGETPNDTFRYP